MNVSEFQRQLDNASLRHPEEVEFKIVFYDPVTGGRELVDFRMVRSCDSTGNNIELIPTRPNFNASWVVKKEKVV